MPEQLVPLSLFNLPTTLTIQSVNPTVGPFNINHTVRFKPTERGLKEMEERFKDKASNWYKLPEIDAEGFMEVRLWEFMYELGQFMFMGAPTVIEDNAFFIKLE